MSYNRIQRALEPQTTATLKKEPLKDSLSKVHKGKKAKVKGLGFVLESVVVDTTYGVDFVTGWIKMDKGKHGYISIPLAFVEILED